MTPVANSYFSGGGLMDLGLQQGGSVPVGQWVGEEIVRYFNN